MVVERSVTASGSSRSSSRRNSTPSQKPPAAGRKDQRPMSAQSIAGSSRLHTEAAVITPAANPSSTRRRTAEGALCRQNTHAAPSDVPQKGSNIP